MSAYTDKEIAAVAWAANAELQALHGDPAPSLPGDTEDAEAHAVTVAGIRAILDGATPEQLHETWMRAREAQGWTYGPRKDSRLKTHPALVPYAELPEHQRVKDRVFTAIVQAMTGQDYGEHVARLVTATPGQAAYEVGDRVSVTGTVVGTNRRLGWVNIDADGSMFAFNRASTNPAISHIAAQEPHAADGPDVCECGHAWAHHAFSDDVCAVVDCPCTRPRPAPQPAPELAAATAERDALREAVRKLHALFGEPDSHGVVHAVTTRKSLERITGGNL